MTDRELLELAAKAAGFINYTMNDDSVFVETGSARGAAGYYWKPLTDDGDALRLAIALGLIIDCSRPSAGEPFKQHHVWIDELCDTATLTRRAIVLVAAEIGKGTK